MEEAIFQGTVNRRPVNRGSVSLTVSNDDGLLPVPFEEVELGRTVYRDGGSEYSINRSSCRLRDVLDLCRDTGLGANAYAIIENRMIDAILSDRAEERRGLFEEAAGIGKYKDRRKAALRRLERAELDLQRLDDVIAEVETKVRSLARQKGKAQRFRTLRDRRLAVEVAVVRHQLDTLQTRLEQVRRELAGDRELGEGYLAELGTAETNVETLHLRQIEAEKARGETAGELEEVRGELIRWERDLAVAEERSAYAGRRLVHIQQERSEATERIGHLEGSAAELQESETTLGEEVIGLQGEMEARKEVEGAAREDLEAAREELQNAQGRLRELTLQLARLNGEATSADSQSTELERHLERLSAEVQDAVHARSDVEAQGDLFASELMRSQESLEQAQGELGEAKLRNETAQKALDEARLLEASSREKVATLTGRIEALRGMERSQEGVEPTVKAALSLSDNEILGTLADSISGDVEVVRAVEAFLGPLAQGLVVRSADAVTRLQTWYREEWEGRGGLILFPLDRVPSQSPVQGSVLEALILEGEGAPWVRALLAGVSLQADGVFQGGDQGVDALSLAGTVVDHRGFIRLGNPLGSCGILERREQVKRLQEELLEAQRLEETAVTRREVSETGAREAGLALEGAWKGLREIEDAFRSRSAEADAHSAKRARMDRHQEDLARQLEGTRATRDRAQERARTCREDLEVLSAEEEKLQEEETAGLERVREAQEVWEGARTEVSALAVEIAQKEGSHSRLVERLQALELARDESRVRVESLDAEEKALREEDAAVSALRSQGAEETEGRSRGPGHGSSTRGGA
jgi:chromosome segregation protein